MTHPHIDRRAIVTGGLVSVAAVQLAPLSWLLAQSPAAGRLWYVAPDVAGRGGAGTLASPWSLAHAASGAGGRIRPGDSVLLRGNADGGDRHVYTPDAAVGGGPTGFTFSLSGRPGAPVRFAAMPGERVIVRNPVDQSAGWVRIADAPGKQIWRSRFAVAGSSEAVMGSFLAAGRRHVLAAYRFDQRAQIEGDSADYRNDGAYYCGPGVVRLADGHLLVRLDPLMGDPRFGERGIIYPGSTDPARAGLLLTRAGDAGIILTGDWLHIDGLDIDGPAIGLRDSGNANHVSGCTIRSPYIGLLCGSAAGTQGGSYAHNHIDGMLDARTSFLSWMDVKGGIEPCLFNRSQLLSPGNASGGRVWANHLVNGFDGSVVVRPGWEYGRYADAAPGQTDAAREAAAWADGNLFEGIWDDALQVTAHAQGLHVHHNRFLGAGYGRDGASSAVDWGSNWPAIHHNIFDNRGRAIFMGKRGRNREAQITDPRYTEEGRAPPNLITAHGEPTGAAYRFHHHFYHNTLVFDRNVGINSQFKPLSSWGNEAAGMSGGRTLVLNNIIIDPGWQQANGGPARFRPYNMSRLRMQRGDNIFDGNAHVSDGPITLFGFVDSAAAPASAYVESIAALRTRPYLADLARLYPRGWEASGVQFIVPDLARLLDDAYRPVDPRLATGAADIQGFALPGMRAHQPWRGAVAPA